MMRLQNGSTSYECGIKVRLLTDLSEEERQRTSTEIGSPSFLSQATWVCLSMYISAGAFGCFWLISCFGVSPSQSVAAEDPRECWTCSLPRLFAQTCGGFSRHF